MPTETPQAQLQEDERQSQLKLLIAKGKEQGYLTYSEVNDHLPSEIVDPEQIEDIVNMINDMGITVYEKAPDAESLLLSDSAVSNDEDVAEEAAAALATVGFSQFVRRCASEGPASGYHPAAQRTAQGRGGSRHGAPAFAVNSAAA